MKTWNMHDELALHSLLELDFLRLRREGKQKPVNFNVIYAFKDKLSEHSSEMKNMLMSDNYPVSYLFHNPLIEGLLKFYGISMNNYIKAKSKNSEFIRDIKTGLDMILESFNHLEYVPTQIPIKEINTLRDFCLNLSEREIYHRFSNPARYVALAA